MKPALFHPKVRAILRTFPEEVRRELGKAIFDLQKGAILGMPLSKPIPSVGRGVDELRIKDRSGVFRVFYLSKRANAVLVFHAFQKKTQKTLQRDIELGQKRLEEMLDEKN
jgi:phage-related protein